MGDNIEQIINFFLEFLENGLYARKIWLYFNFWKISYKSHFEFLSLDVKCVTYSRFLHGNFETTFSKTVFRCFDNIFEVIERSRGKVH
jgi:hypothetical protein